MEDEKRKVEDGKIECAVVAGLAVVQSWLVSWSLTLVRLRLSGIESS